MAITLKELKAQNAADAEENANQTDENTTEVEDETTSQVVEDETEIVADGDTEEPNDGREPDSEGADDPDAEDWMNGDEPDSQADKKYSGTDIGNAKAKLRAKLEKKFDGETEKLQARIAELESVQQGAQPSGLERPKRDDFVDSDEPDEAYFEALTDWKLEKQKASQAAENATVETQRNQQANALKISQGVDAHYERAAELSEKSDIKPEAYQAADMAFRQAVDSVFPQAGDAIADGLISMLGKGSEKVMFSLGVNSQKRSEFISRLKEDPNGLKAMAYLGELKAELNAPKKRKSTAPQPAADTKGDASESSNIKALKKKYAAASKSGNQQEAFNIRMKGRAAGANVNEW